MQGKSPVVFTLVSILLWNVAGRDDALTHLALDWSRQKRARQPALMRKRSAMVHTKLLERRRDFGEKRTSVLGAGVTPGEAQPIIAALHVQVEEMAERELPPVASLCYDAIVRVAPDCCDSSVEVHQLKGKHRVVSHACRPATAQPHEGQPYDGVFLVGAAYQRCPTAAALFGRRRPPAGCASRGGHWRRPYRSATAGGLIGGGTAGNAEQVSPSMFPANTFATLLCSSRCMSANKCLRMGSSFL